MCYDVFNMKIKLFKYKRFKDGGCAYKKIDVPSFKVTNVTSTLS